MEKELCRIPEVRAARIAAGDHSQPVDVHILATTGTHANQLVRDVLSVAITSSGVDVDRRVVSVVQLEDVDGHGAPVTATPSSNGSSSVSAAQSTARVIVESVLVAKQDLKATATVTLRRDGEQVVGTADGTVASTARWRIVAEASLNALRLLEPAAASVAIEMAGVQRIGDRELGIVTLVLEIPPNEELLAGVAPVRAGSEEDAVARAVLDATNRRLARLR